MSNRRINIGRPNGQAVVEGSSGRGEMRGGEECASCDSWSGRARQVQRTCVEKGGWESTQCVEEWRIEGKAGEGKGREENLQCTSCA